MVDSAAENKQSTMDGKELSNISRIKFWTDSGQALLIPMSTVKYIIQKWELLGTTGALTGSGLTGWKSKEGLP